MAYCILVLGMGCTASDPVYGAHREHRTGSQPGCWSYDIERPESSNSSPGMKSSSRNLLVRPSELVLVGCNSVGREAPSGQGAGAVGDLLAGDSLVDPH